MKIEFTFLKINSIAEGITPLFLITLSEHF